MDPEEVERFVAGLHEIDADGGYTYVFGMGRSGLVGCAFLERLSNLDYNAFMIGNPGTPAIREGDAVVLISGSGETSLTVDIAKMCKQRGALIFGITSKPDSSLGAYCDHVLRVPGKTRIDAPFSYYEQQIKGSHAPLAPLGTLFELSVLAVLDSVIAQLAELKGFSEEDMQKMHFNY
jgi:6-phospho-3-hexuloisomerase